ncbi:MAG: DUF4835 family protein [Flavobacteriaceae bacterium]|nr:DUF4835 family protein [Bacteroidia bacterium]MBT8289062.1 DUF4835 family protein [Bacteroidia bacterium]NNF74779.1 DUF4835 family protein [Flavobacteriaceae bacterium]NNK72735.1 DUF4835 family protein [Flavobacteriaceae bacterium]
MHKLLLILIILGSSVVKAQELNCDVVVNAQLTGNENVQVFRTLEKQLNEFVNNSRWTSRTYSAQERINCSMVITINGYDSDVFQGTIQVSSSRPVFNSTYETPVYNFNDRDFNFRYLEFQNLIYSPSQFDSNLVSMIAFHIYIILGMDADTFATNGGDEYYQQARTIVGYSQQNNSKGWEPPKGGDQTRSALIDQILSPTFKEFRSVMYSYHRSGLDLMHSNAKNGKTSISQSLSTFKALNSRRPNSFILRVFFDAKSDEIQDIFSDGPSVNITDLVTTLTRIAPMHASKWRAISF